MKKKQRQPFPIDAEPSDGIEAWNMLISRCVELSPSAADLVFLTREGVEQLFADIQTPSSFRQYKLGSAWRLAFEGFLTHLFGDRYQVESRDSVEGTIHLGGYRVRASLSRNFDGLELVCRLLPGSIPTPHQIQIEADLLDRFCSIDWGLVVVAGATCTGKSTTIASLIQERARKRGGRFITLEDPIEYIYPEIGGASFSQREIDSHVSSFARGLRDVKRQSPSGGIVVQEIRSGEEARIALEAALAGQFVVCTIHGGSVQSAIRRFDDFCSGNDGGRNGLAMALRIALCQKLVTNEAGALSAVREICWNTDSIATHIRSGDFDRITQIMELHRSIGMKTFAA